MKVTIKKFNVDMDVKNNGIEFAIADTDGTHLGDLVLTKSKIIWCKGRTTPARGKSLTWRKFMDMMGKLN